ncbi:hypothetical protein DPMN_066300 [Dreissena polymorpha]|uniref:Uncharacterized protein n=1 Tax=Dreissena polymorpha TaxID=45954 RepID=A0A9D4BSQ7_DREPO|nr:hypothetical protein DPMN_066300 [Dreissena polymorpha]
MTEVQTWTVYPTWCVYPRVQYFRNRFLSLHPRFERTVGSVQWKVKYYLEAIKVWFESDLEIKVITKSDFPTERFIVDRTSLPDNKQQSPDSDDTKTKKSRVYVCYIEGQNVRDPFFIQSLKDVVDVFNKEPPSTESILYIAVKFSEKPLDDECKILQRNLDEQLSWRPLSWDKSYSVVFVNNHTDLPVAISDYFEQQLVEGVSVIATCLESFIPSEAYRKRDTKNLEVNLKAFSEKSDAPKSIAFIILDLPKPTDTDDWEHELDSLQSLARLIKCQVLLPFYEELLIQPDVYHDILVKGEYESKVAGHLSSSTKKLLLDKKKIAMNAEVSVFLNYRYSDIVKAIIEDICPLVKAIEVEYDNRSQICTKMLYEINKYLGQSKFGRQIRGLIEPPYIPRSIRQRVLSIKEVYCIGTIYNQFNLMMTTDWERFVCKSIR